jgi:hypothetical protein
MPTKGFVMKKWLILLMIISPTFADAQTITNHVSQAVINEIGGRFAKTMNARGMAGTTVDIQACYDATNFNKTSANQIAVSACILYDISAMDFDQSMRNDFVARGMNDPGPATPFLTDKSFGARMSIYASIPFGDNNFQEILDYYGDGINQVSMDVVNDK